jgi:hypothetical protein
MVFFVLHNYHYDLLIISKIKFIINKKTAQVERFFYIPNSDYSSSAN